MIKLIKRTAKKIIKQLQPPPIKYINHPVYKKIYFPCYNDSVQITTNTPTIYNKDGKEMSTFFIRDRHTAHDPYFDSSKYFIWDRYNIGLNTHFYTHDSMLETMGTPTYKYGMLFESPFIVPEDYNILKNNKALASEFESIFTYDEDLLNKIENAKFFPSCANVWYGKEDKSNIKISNSVFEKKEKNISMMCSDKQYTDFHKIRHAFATVAQKNDVDIFGKFNGGKYLQFKADSLEKYRYQIVVENGIAPFYFTEKILDCFVSMTIPIYLGASKIGDFFNTDGIIQISKDDLDNLDTILANCNKRDYENRLNAIKGNFQRALKYMNINDYLYEMHFLKYE